VGLERGPLSLASTTENTAVGIRHAGHVAPSIRKSWQSVLRQAAVARSVLFARGLSPWSFFFYGTHPVPITFISHEAFSVCSSHPSLGLLIPDAPPLFSWCPISITRSGVSYDPLLLSLSLSLSHTHKHTCTYKTYISLGHIGSINKYIRLIWIHVSSFYACHLVTPVVPTVTNGKKKETACSWPPRIATSTCYMWEQWNATDHARSSHVRVQRRFYEGGPKNNRNRPVAHACFLVTSCAAR
jgi:hypothetical protein